MHIEVFNALLKDEVNEVADIERKSIIRDREISGPQHGKIVT
jgi:hypothetical protein